MKKLLILLILTALASTTALANNTPPNGTIFEPTEQTLEGEDFEYVCRVVSAEARGEGLEGQMGVAEVIKNRSNFYGISPREIASTPNQFAKPYKGEIPQSVIDAVDGVFNENMTVFGNNHVMYFHANYMTPWWANKFEFVKTINNHTFYKLSVDK